MNSSLTDIVEDLKQFIDAKFSQQDTRIDGKFNELRAEMSEIREEVSETRADLSELRDEMRAGFAGVADAMEENNKEVDSRLSKLEQQAV